MKYAIDETELARLEALAAHYTNVVTLDSVSIPHKIIKSVPALIAEIRRLRAKNISLREDVYALSEAWDYEYEDNQRHEHMVAELMEKVEAWEWFEECYEVMRLLAQIGPNRADAHEEAVISAFDALKRAAHADCE